MTLPEEQLKDTVFEGRDVLKLVVQCRNERRSSSAAPRIPRLSGVERDHASQLPHGRSA